MNGPIRFGTSGWRGILADEITLPRARRLAVAVARWLAESRVVGASRARPRILVGHDTRYLGPELTAAACAVLAAHGVAPIRARSPVPTPVLARAVRYGEAEAGLVFTASHNSPAYHGAKVIAGWGGGIPKVDAERIETLAASVRDPGRTGSRSAPRAPLPARDLVPDYVRQLNAWIDADAFRRCRVAVTYDALHGSGAGVCDRALRALGARVEVLRGEPSPRFGGEAPDPAPHRLVDLAARVRRGRGLRLGLATDGDADRYAVVDQDGSVLSATEAVALLVAWLAETGRVKRGVAISIATGSLVERVAAWHGLRVVRRPIGFKHLSRALADAEADVAGEESGGFAVDAFARDKDGILAGALLAEQVASSRRPLRQSLALLVRRHGPCACDRAALAATPAARERLARLVAAPPERVDGAPVRTIETLDGLRLGFDDGFLMLRASGTEPLLRLYGEARERAALARRLEAGRRLLDSAAAVR